MSSILYTQRREQIVDAIGNVRPAERSERAPWFAAAAGLALMAVLGFTALGPVESLGAAASPALALAEAPAAYGWVVMALYAVVVLDVVVAWALWRVLRVDQPGGAALAAAFRLVYSAVFAGAIAQFDHAVRLGTGADGAAALDPAAADAAVREQLAGFDAAWNGGLLLFGAHLAVVGWLLVRRTGVVTRLVGVLVLVSGIGYAADTVLRLLAPGLDVGVAAFTFIGEVVLIGWLVVGGIRVARRRPAPSAPTEPAVAAVKEA
jgi:hypothetical protein